jgi:hypothetical protein
MSKKKEYKTRAKKKEKTKGDKKTKSKKGEKTIKREIIKHIFFINFQSAIEEW